MRLLLLASSLSLVLPTSAQTNAPVSLQPGTPIQLQRGAFANQVAVLNVDGDALPDLVVPVQGLNAVYFYIQPRLHSFGWLTLPPACPQPLSVFSLNFTTTSTATPPTDFVVLQANGDFVPWRKVNSSYQAGTPVPIRRGRACAPTDRLVMGNYIAGNGPDFGCLSNGPQPTLAQVANLGNGVFQAGFPDPRPAGDSALVLVTGDIDRDFSRLEEAVMPQLDDPAGSIDIYPRTPATTPGISWWRSATPVALATGGPGPTRAVAVGDVNGDGDTDLVVAAAVGPAVGAVYVRRKNVFDGSAFTFSAPVQTYPVVAVPRELRLADLNGDGRPELLVVGDNATLHIFTNTSRSGTATFDPLPSVLTTGPDPGNLCVADADGDGDLDVLLPCRGDGTIRLFWNMPQVLATKPAAWEARLSVFPNPATASLRLAWQGPAPRVQATLLDLAGRAVRRWNADMLGADLPVGDLPRGLYLLQLAGATGQVHRRVQLD